MRSFLDFRFQKSFGNSVIFFIPPLMAVFYASLFGFVLIPKILRLKRDIKENRKEVFIGKIQSREKRTFKNTENFFWTLSNKIKIELSKEQFEKYDKEEIFTIYYSPRSKFLFNVKKFE
jgi:hypothetical protein